MSAMTNEEMAEGAMEDHGWEATVEKELRELYAMEYEAARCYEDLHQAQRLNEALRARLARECGEDEVTAVAKSVALETRRRELESIGKGDEGRGRDLSDGVASTGGVARPGDWVDGLPLRFRREVELERALGRVTELEVKVETLKAEGSDLSSLIHENARHLNQVEAGFEAERQEFARRGRDLEQQLKRAREDAEKMESVSGDLMEEKDGLRLESSRMQELLMRQKGEQQAMFGQVRELEEKLSSTMRSLSEAATEVEELRGRERLQSEQLQGAILARNTAQEEASSGARKVRQAEARGKKLEKQLGALRKQMEQAGRKAVADREALMAEVAAKESEIKEKEAAISSLEGEAGEAGEAAGLKEEVESLKKKEAAAMVKLRAAVKKGKGIQEQLQATQKKLEELSKEGAGTASQEAAEEEHQQMVADLQGQLDAEKERANAMEASESALKERVGELEAAASEAERLGTEITNLQDQLGEMEDDNTRLEAASALSCGQRDEAQAQVASLEQKVESLSSELQTLQGTADGTEGMQARISELESQLESQAKELEIAQSSLQEQSAGAASQEAAEEEHQQMVADLQKQLDAEKERANAMEASESALKERVGELEAMESHQAVAEAEAVEQQQLIAELESRLQVERERADRNEAASLSLGEMDTELGSLRTLLSSKDEDISRLEHKVEEAIQNKLNSERALQGELEALAEEVAAKEGQIKSMGPAAAGQDDAATLRREAETHREYIARLEGDLTREREAQMASSEEKGRLEGELRDQSARAEALERELGEARRKLGEAEAAGGGKGSDLVEECERLREKQGETMHKLKAAVVKGKGIQKKLEQKERELEEARAEAERAEGQLREARAELAAARAGAKDAAEPAATVAAEMESWNAGADDDGVWEAGDAPAAPGGAEPPRDIGALMDRMAAEAEASDDEEGEDVKIDEALKNAGTNLWNWVSGA